MQGDHSTLKVSSEALFKESFSYTLRYKIVGIIANLFQVEEVINGQYQHDHAMTLIQPSVTLLTLATLYMYKQPLTSSFLSLIINVSFTEILTLATLYMHKQPLTLSFLSLIINVSFTEIVFCIKRDGLDILTLAFH